MTFADKGWIPPHQAMQAIKAGMSESIIDSFQLDIDKQYREIQKIMQIGMGHDPDKLDREMAGLSGFQVERGLEFPTPGEQDNHAVHEDVLTQWMKTADFEQQNQVVQEGAHIHLREHSFIREQEEQKQSMLQAQRAEQLGAANAAADQAPGAPSTLGEEGASEALGDISAQ